MKKALQNNKGLTLIEVLVSIVILGIIAVAFLPIFTNSFVYIMSAGKRSKADFEAQRAMENRLAGSGKTFDNVETTESGTELSISFGSDTINVPGKTVNVTYNDGKQNVTLTTFIPD